MSPTGHLPRCGLKQTDSLPESWENWPNPPFPTPHTIKQLRAFLGVTGFCRIWIPRYAACSRLLLMLLLLFLFGSYIINALKIVSPSPIKVQAKPVHLRKPTNPWSMRKTHHTGPNPTFWDSIPGKDGQMPPGLPMGAQQTDFPPDAITTFSRLPTTGLGCKWSLGKTICLRSQGSHKFPNSGWIPSFYTTPPLSRKQIDWSVPIIPTKGWHCWGGWRVPRLTPKPDPLIYDHLKNTPACFPACKISATFHFSTSYTCWLIPGKWRPAGWLLSGRNTLPPSWCGHSYNAPYPFQPSCSTLILRETAQQSVLQ
jgi:hypothetical protein